MPNRLARETSPYLQQHADNPVDWYPWGEEALSRARAEDRPILLSVGYSACHWCHVMERESFADAATAALMNEHFVPVKVDREERPDVDSLYMRAVQQMTGRGGWPMTVFLKPDGSPFYGGTYYPPRPAHGLPSFGQVLLGVAEAWRERRAEVDAGAASLHDVLVRGMSVSPPPEAITEPMLQRAFHGVAARFDHTWGGFGGAPKFPQPMLVDFLLRFGRRTASADALRLAEVTLERMARGGIHDQVGGGFHRYATDVRWLVPHFEKMLYDNALLARVYLHAFQATGRADFRLVVEDTLGWALREMRDAGGGFHSSLDADSEGVEGRFYVWSAGEIDAALGAEEGPRFRALYGASEGGNWEGTNILHLPRPLDEVATELGIGADALESLAARGRAALHARREARVRPGRDEKVIAGWNAMMIHTLAEAGRVLDRPEWVRAAVECADFVLREMRVGDRLRRSWRGGVARIDGFLDDHALLCDALVELYFATFDPRWAREARTLADWMVERFFDADDGVFHDTPRDGERLVVRPRDIYDNATPAGTSAAAFALLRLARLVGDPGHASIATRVIESMGKLAVEVPQGFGHLLCALAYYLAPPTEIALAGEAGAADTEALLAVVRARFLPDTTLALRTPEMDEAEIAELIPLLAERTPRDGRATAYVCRHFACRRPVTTPEALAAELDALEV